MHTGDKQHKLQLQAISSFLITYLYARRRRDILWDHPWRAGSVPHSLSEAYLQNYTS